MKHALDCSTGAGMLCCDCGAERLRVLHDYPVMEKSGETSLDENGKTVKWNRFVHWRVVGTATSFEHAKAKFGGHPVVESTNHERTTS